MEEKIKFFIRRYDELGKLLSDPEATRDVKKYTKLSQEFAQVQTVMQAYEAFQKTSVALEKAQQYANSETDAELKSLAQEEVSDLAKSLEQQNISLRTLLIPPDPLDNKNIIVEIRAGTGGEEAGLFAADLYRMYVRYAERKNWQVELISTNESEIGGMREVVFEISGAGAYGRLRYESGAHRVQRIPVTESSGRIQTSAATVAVLPEAEETDIDIRKEDLRIDTYRASGAGGQHINKTDSAVRITHLPTGVAVAMQDSRSQIKNREKAMSVLRSRLFEMEQEKKDKERSDARRNQVGSGDRSERIRTYNFPQGRLTDHRINLTLYKLDNIMEGDLDEVLDALTLAAHKDD
ncbi:MAG: peptide chain release factor 1 [Spirochaetia bacterium]